MSASHTPGPWRWMNDDTLVADYSRRNVVMTGGRNGTLQTCAANGRLRQLRADEPNACLIAAAPDLLAALRELVAEVERRGLSLPENISPASLASLAPFDPIPNAKAAIAKAEGRLPEGV
jgi:hypothetical protein